MPEASSAQNQSPNRRGLLGPFDHDLSLWALLIHADIEPAAKAFAEDIGTQDWQQGVDYSELAADDPDAATFFPFQLSGLSWTTIVHRYHEQFTQQAAKRLSAALNTKTIFFGHSDTAGVVGYFLYDAGKLAEVFSISHSTRWGKLTPAQFTAIEESGSAGRGAPGFFCESGVRELHLDDYQAVELADSTEAYRKAVARLLDSFLRSQDAFVAFNDLDEEGREYFPHYEISQDEVVRMDIVSA